MGVIWTVLPLDSKIKLWLDQLGVAYPDKPSRLPTDSEIKAALQALIEYEIEITDDGLGPWWRAEIVHRKLRYKASSATLNVRVFTGDNAEQRLSFEKGSEELNALILGFLSKSCGPLVLIPDTGENPTVIEPGK